VRDFIKTNYMMVQYNLHGDEEVIDLDGETLTEKTAARKWGVLFTPTIFFLPEDADEGKDVASLNRRCHARCFQQRVHSSTCSSGCTQKGYETDEDFQRYHARRIRSVRPLERRTLTECLPPICATACYAQYTLKHSKV
jgi:thioredoxin-related protein